MTAGVGRIASRLSLSGDSVSSGSSASIAVVRQIVTRVPDDLAERLKERAAIENRSVNATVVDAVERVLSHPASRRRAWRARNGHVLAQRLPHGPRECAQRSGSAVPSGPALSTALEADRSER